MKNIIETKKLCKTFSNGGVQQHVLRNVNLEIYEGDFTIIMGASGAGKSTLLYSLSGMDKPTLGSVSFDGVESMSVLDNIMAAGLLVYKDKNTLVKKAGDLLKAVNIDETLWNKFPTQISGGEAQRVGIARSLINDPKLVFADEPTGALNSQTGKAVLDTLTSFNEKGQSIVMVTHDISSARRGNRILYVKDGEIAGECNLGKYVTGDKERHQKLNDFLATMGW